jgi:hypothetical protein
VEIFSGSVEELTRGNGQWKDVVFLSQGKISIKLHSRDKNTEATSQGLLVEEWALQYGM